MLWNDSLVMKDLETESLWSHLLGRAMSGPLESTELEIVPSVLTDWKSWTRQHPDTLVCMLPRVTRHHRTIGASMLMRLCIGLVNDEDTKCWTLALLQKHPAINDEIGERPVLATFVEEHGTAVLFDRRVKGRELTFEMKEEKLIDHETGSEWDRELGIATAGELAGERLHQLPGIISYLDKWRVFHPDGAIEDIEL